MLRINTEKKDKERKRGKEVKEERGKRGEEVKGKTVQ